MKLLMDIGNSRIKWCCANGGGLTDAGVVDRDGCIETALDRAFAGAPPAGALLCSVADADLNRSLEAWMGQRWGWRPRWFRSDTRTLGLINGYPDPSQLGTDRWAALLGARGLHPPPLAVIDCGTAVTLDVVDAGDHHLGGLIAPGMELARRSLLTRTANVRAAAPHASGMLGRSTAECVANGTGLALSGALDRWIREVDAMLDGVTWLATGGGWPVQLAKRHSSIIYDPDLVLKGLARTLGVNPA